ncbi:MAG: rhodanese-like domain-containing protein [Burkholderiales bacterium]
MSEEITPAQLKAALGDGQELALVDAREQGVYFHGHLLFAACIPLSHLEMRVADSIPRQATRIVLCDAGGEDLAHRAARKLSRFGYSDVRVLAGGVAAWKAAGYEVFSGINVVSKAFGEYVEHRHGTAHISAEDLARKVAGGEDLVILDSRPLEEYRNLSIPGGVDCPGAELVHRVFDAAPNPNTLVVVNCAGRTRSIIGAQSLINAGIPNKVMALKNGTMGWELAGFQVARGQTAHAPTPAPAGIAKASSAAARVKSRFGVRAIHMEQLLQLEREPRTLYVLDVRTAAEYEAGHLPGSRHAPGGQLVQATDEYAVTRHARIVLVDDTGVRAIMTASWLLQMGWKEVYVLEDDLSQTLEYGAAKANFLDFAVTPSIPADALKAALDSGGGAAILDLGTSLQYRKQHIPGAYWGIRSRLTEVLANLESPRELFITSPDGVLAHYAARDIAALKPEISVRVLEGGTRAWTGAGYPVASGPEKFACEPNDIWYKPYEQAGGVRKAMEDYLAWEVNLMPQIERDGDAKFYSPFQ